VVAIVNVDTQVAVEVLADADGRLRCQQREPIGESGEVDRDAKVATMKRSRIPVRVVLRINRCRKKRLRILEGSFEAHRVFSVGPAQMDAEG
jgi:hypothetical protein